MEDMAQKCSLSYKTLVAVRRVLLAQFSSFAVNGADLYEELKRTVAILPTGIQSLDKLLDSGLYTGEITELVGAPASGKTQVCLRIAANTALSLKQEVLYIDAMGGFTASRLLQLLQCQTDDEEAQVEALQRVQVIRVFEAYKMLDVLQDFRSSLAQQAVSGSGMAKVLVVDSVSAVIYPLLGSRQPDGMALMMHLALELKTLAKDFGMAVVLTNHVTKDPNSSHLKPALGRSWSFVPSTRILLEDNRDLLKEGRACWTASLVKSPRQPVGICVALGASERTGGSPGTSGEGP
ncbi:DNA repair protein RAD51 homolog 4 isoform X2 [Sceloporus undulatus]|nr:DNA repair protein RAD51 homolog 4 isoform X2 [Sceloporus undulatus]